MPSNKIRGDALLGERAKCRDGNRQDSRLRIRGELQLIFGAVTTHFEKIKTNGRVRFFKYTLGFRKTVREVAPHSWILRGLPRKQKCKFAHSSRP